MRMIDADAMMRAYQEVLCNHVSCIECSFFMDDKYCRFETILSEAPTVDAVPVVRCKDCKYWQDNNDGYPHEECRWGHGETPDANDFCSYGERNGGAE